MSVPAIAEFVLNNIPDFNSETGEGGYQVLNANTIDEGDKKFTDMLITSLPQLSEMEEVNQDLYGSINLYKVVFAGREFYVKEYPDIKFTPLGKRVSDISNSDRDAYFSKMSEFYAKAQEHLEDYLPLSIFLKRTSSDEGNTEYLIIQEVCTGNQYKRNVIGSSITNYVSTNNEQKAALSDFFTALYSLNRNTGYTFLDLDFFFNLNTLDIKLFDFELIHRSTSAWIMTDHILRACEVYGVDYTPPIKISES